MIEFLLGALSGLIAMWCAHIPVRRWERRQYWALWRIATMPQSTPISSAQAEAEIAMFNEEKGAGHEAP